MTRRVFARRRLLRLIATLLAAPAALGACTPGDVTDSGVVYRSGAQSLRRGGGGGGKRGGGGRS
jgi:hypothetical protein